RIGGELLAAARGAEIVGLAAVRIAVVGGVRGHGHAADSILDGVIRGRGGVSVSLGERVSVPGFAGLAAGPVLVRSVIGHGRRSSGLRSFAPTRLIPYGGIN